MRHSCITLVFLALTFTLTRDQAQSQPPGDKVTLAFTLPWDADWVTAVSFLDNKRVAAGNNLGQILVWELPEKTGGPASMPLLRLDGHDNTINRLLTTPDGLLISASNDHTIRIWDVKTPAKRSDAVVLNASARREKEMRKQKPPAPVEAKVQVIEASQVLKGHHDWILGLSITKDGKTLVSGDNKGEVIVWDLPEGKERRRWKLKGWVWAMAIAPKAESLLVSERVHLVFDSGRHAGLKLWNPLSGEMQHDLGKDKDFAKQMFAAAAFSPDAKTAAVVIGGETGGNDGGRVVLLDPAKGKKIRELTPGHHDGATDVLFHPDGKHLFSSGRDTQVRMWRVDDGKLVQAIGTPRGGQFKDWIHAVALSPDTRLLAAADMAGQVQIWTLPSK
jgi:WD40 repeat protein